MRKKQIKIGIAVDSFKGSLTSLEAAECIERGLKNVLRNISVVKVPMADGGEGLVRTIVDATGGKTVNCMVRDPVGCRIKSSFGITKDGKTAVIEMAAASGLVLLKPKERNPMVTGTYGTGELIRHALRAGVKKILVGIGGSATNDGGTGMARALGVRFYDMKGFDLPEGGGALKNLARIDMRGIDKRLKKVSVEVACDVDNPLIGPRGAAYIYGPQKGATQSMIRKLDAGLRIFAEVIKRDMAIDVLHVPGSGAAGGLGAGLMAFAGGVLRPGVDVVMDFVKLERKLKDCDLVITGEGRMDGQTVFGKTPSGVARIARKLGIPVIAIAGSLGRDVNNVHETGIHAFFSALQEPVEETLLAERGPAMLVSCAEQVGRLLALKFRGRGQLRMKI